MKPLTDYERSYNRLVEKEERRNQRLDRWFGIDMSVQIRVTGVDAHNHVTKEAGEQRAHVTIRIPLWLCDVLILPYPWRLKLRQSFGGAAK